MTTRVDPTKLLVLFGAGASADLCPDAGPILDGEYEPPVLRTMFQKKAFDEAFNYFPRAHGIMSDVRSEVRAEKGVAFEETLSELAQSGDPDIVRAMLEVPLALQLYFSRISDRYTNQPINYSALMTRLMRRGIKVAFATLNYDTLLEQAVAQFTGKSPTPGEFVYQGTQGRWSITKLHGSVDWGFPWFSDGDFHDGVDAMRMGASVPFTDRRDIEMGIPYNLKQREHWYYPALALPVSGKGFVCPPEMEQRLARFMGECENFLFIGFSAQDDDVLDFLARNMRKVEPNHIPPFRGGVVSKDDVDAVCERLSRVPPLSRAFEENLIVRFGQGFTKFIENNLHQFLDYLQMDFTDAFLQRTQR
ncbi:MAG TPA: SIR2 family protein [Dehalococcoidia bacterium]|nr:SIR2 family protein [Dehalococcoidia bacterium]